MPGAVTVAIPTLNAGPDFARTLDAVRAQHLDDRELELLICDSGSSDQTVPLARARSAEVIEIPTERFSHGGTRNLLMSRAQGEYVAFLTQDAVPASPNWLSTLVAAFTLAPNVGLAFGPYRPHAGAGLGVSRELIRWFESFSDGGPRIDVLPAEARNAPPRHFMGHLGFFTDANGCVSRAAWEEVPFRQVAYAEDHLLAQDMLRAGYAKVYVPGAAVIHSHDYSTTEWLRRSFDEGRAVREVYGFALGCRAAIRNVMGGVGGDRRWAREHRVGSGPRVVGPSLVHHSARATGTFLGGHARWLPGRVVRHLSLERRG